MLKKTLYSFIVKVVNKLHAMGVFKILQESKRNLLEGVNVLVGEKCAIDPSAILITNGAGKIELKGHNYIGRNVEIGTDGNIVLGSHTSIQDRCILLGDLDIGKSCVFAPNIYVSSGRHYYDYKPELYIRDQDFLVLNDVDLKAKHSKKVIIEDDCWIGINTVIMSGVKICRGSVIGSNSVVTKDVEPFSIMAGSPAKFIKKRLELNPKLQLTYNNNDDLPNFYKGFNCDLENLEVDRKLGGITTSGSFEVYMNNTEKKIKITGKKLIKENLVISYNNQEKTISNNTIQEIIFDAAAVNYHRFVTNFKDNLGKILLVQNIQITNQ
jgi:acetyltransferase-like isoleucine patch superfamily enzyme